MPASDGPPADGAPSAACGFVFAATRPRHRILARRAARSLRLIVPGAAIDLFADERIEDPVFDRVHLLERNWHRPKIEALRRSRFDRTIYLDGDVIAVADATDIFALLDRVDIAGVHDNNRNSDNALAVAGDAVPAAFPSINSGVLGVRRSDRTRAFLEAWEGRMARHRHRVDQPALRSLLWESGLRIGILPVEYNLMDHALIGAMGRHMTAPRLIHMREIHKQNRDPGDPMRPYDLAEFYSGRTLRRLYAILGMDRTLGAVPGAGAGPGARLSDRALRARLFAARIRPLRLRYLIGVMARRIAPRTRRDR